ncbi:perilipin-2-like isoform X1 [Bufo bufo]|uniref:perilipin-2-like isoform X1 n=1 Tax=Bufo bufo TaxID=8384 RepID=UPI001ABE7532|nr:perilipin-2-like isoform X1 [Bufo bufo]
MADVVVEQQQQNVVVRLINLPLVSSTYDMVYSAYVNTKDNHPYLKSVCDVAEKSVKTITSVALTSARPILQKLEPQIALANNIACVGLDKIEEKLPILYQPSGKVVANASEAVFGVKDAVIQSIAGVVDKTKGAVQDSVEMTKAVVNGSINTVLGSGVVKVVSTRVDTALTKSESLLEQYLPPTDEELAKEATKTEGFELSIKPSYYVRLGSLSTKTRKRAYQQALTRIKDAKCRSQEAIAQLQNTVDLMEYARKNMNDANQKIHDAQEKIYNKWVVWTKGTGQDASGEHESTEQIESRTLTIARSLTHQLQTTCLSLVSSVQGLPQNIQNQAHNASAMAADVYQNFRSASSFREMSDGLLNTSKAQFTKMKDSMDDVMDYLVNNTPLNWLVPDFSINDLASETDGNADVLVEEEMQDFSGANGRVINQE